MKPSLILYSFRRCPYAMRARLALYYAGLNVEIREVVLRDKPPSMLDFSPKATVPVLIVNHGSPNQQIIDESIDIMRFALEQNDPDDWEHGMQTASPLFLQDCHNFFIPHLNKYKYAKRYDDVIDPNSHRAEAMTYLSKLDQVMEHNKGGLFGAKDTYIDMAIFPFIRQFAMVDKDWFDAQPFSALQQWLDRKLTSLLFQSIMRKYVQWHAGDPPIYWHD